MVSRSLVVYVQALKVINDIGEEANIKQVVDDYYVMLRVFMIFRVRVLYFDLN